MNSRRQVSNVPSHQRGLERAANSAMVSARKSGTRALLVVQAVPNDWLESFAVKHKAVFMDARSATDRADRISAVLGSEQQLIVMRLTFRPDLGLLAAVAGTIVAGGLLVLALSCDEQSHSSQRLLRLAQQFTAQFPDRVISMTHFSDDTLASVNDLANPALPENTEDTSTLCLANHTLPRTLNPKAVTEQAALLSAAYNHLDTHSGGCLVVRGRRGRGKSTLLARIAMHLEQRGAHFQVTAMHESALKVYRQRVQSNTNRYISPEKAESTPPATLLVEEASSFALSKLQTYLAKCEHVVLCTTTEGYEMSGRALDVRLLADVVQYDKPVLQLEALQPWRWAEGDPLEHFLDALLLNTADRVKATNTANPTVTTSSPASRCSVRHVAQEELHRNESLLSSVHALLLEAHYQTTPKDLEHLLDAPTVQLWIQQVDDLVVGVLLLEFEGPIEPSLHHSIMARSRRLPHQLLPQLLAQTANLHDALQKRFARVIRIAVAQELRRQGLATALLHSVTAQMTTPVDAIGASFAADPHTMAFWNSQGYTQFHRGFRANPRTGRNAVAVLRSFDSVTSQALQCAADISRDNENARQAAANAPVQVTNQNTANNMQTPINEQDRQLLQRFAAGQRSQHDTFAALQRLFAVNKQPPTLTGSISRRQYELELRQFVQQWVDSSS